MKPLNDLARVKKKKTDLLICHAKVSVQRKVGQMGGLKILTETLFFWFLEDLLRVFFEKFSPLGWALAPT